MNKRELKKYIDIMIISLIKKIYCIMAKGKYTRVEVNDDGTITLLFHYQGRTKGLKNEDFSKLENYLKKEFKGFVGFDTIMVLAKEVFLDIRIERVDNEPISFNLEEQEEPMTYLVKLFINGKID